MKDAITTAQAAAYLNRSAITLERWRRLRVGPPYYYVMGRVLYLQADIDAWLLKNKRDGLAAE
jgi:hypothetical protein